MASSSGTLPMNPPSRLKIWMQAMRLFSFTASIVPIAIGCALAIVDGEFSFWLALVMLLAGCATHAGCNLANDYFDHVKGVDDKALTGTSRVIQQRLLEPYEVWRGMIVAFAIATALGLIVVAETGWPILVVALCSLAAAVLYTGGPKPLGYMALGEVTVFIFMGLVMVMGAYYVLVGEITWRSFLAAAPIGFLSAAILHANDIRDVDPDKAAGKTTLAILLGRTGANIEYLLLVVAAYVSAIALMVVDIDLWPVAIVGASIPIAWRLIRFAFSDAEGRALNPLLRKSAGLHLRFGALMVAGLLISAAM
ncbi:1,4-dihydroxy-2-naphthoate polyprenyltransferase [soil metagenome]